MAEPMPLAGACKPPAPVPGAVALAQGGGGGGGGDLSLPANVPTAWDDFCYPCPACYVYLGGLGLTRQRLGHGPVAYLDPGNIDNGVPVAPTAPVVQDFSSLRPEPNWGVIGTVGYHFDNYAVEASGFYLFQNDSFHLDALRGRLDVPFAINNGQPGNPPIPLGFEGTNNLWLQADIVRTSLQSTLLSAEANAHWWLGPSSTFHWFTGIRYLGVEEQLRIYTGDQDLTGPQPDPRRQADYAMRTHNHILGGQLGFEYSKGLTHWLAATIKANGAWGVDFIDINASLQRGDGNPAVARFANKSDTSFSQIYELGLYLDFCVAANMRFRAGYQMMWVVDVAEAVDQVSYDLRNLVGQQNYQGSIFYQGPAFVARPRRAGYVSWKLRSYLAWALLKP
jgi:hypothetical protein